MKTPRTQPERLAPERHRQGDFFVADPRGSSAKDDAASMEHPLSALKTGDRRIRRCEHNGNSIEVQPGAKGQATIHDTGVRIYRVSQLVHAPERGQEDVLRTVHLPAFRLAAAGRNKRLYTMRSTALAEWPRGRDGR